MSLEANFTEDQKCVKQSLFLHLSLEMSDSSRLFVPQGEVQSARGCGAPVGSVPSPVLSRVPHVPRGHASVCLDVPDVLRAQMLSISAAGSAQLQKKRFGQQEGQSQAGLRGFGPAGRDFRGTRGCHAQPENPAWERPRGLDGDAFTDTRSAARVMYHVNYFGALFSSKQNRSESARQQVLSRRPRVGCRVPSRLRKFRMT